jgi:hypothetical protein
MSVAYRAPESDPVASAAIAAEAAARITADSSEAAARAAADAAKQDAATAATDTELAGEASARDAAIATHAGLKRGVHGIPSSVGAGQGLIGDGSGGWSAVDLATQAELDSEAAARTSGDAIAVPLAQKGAPSGVASLGTAGKVPEAQLPLLLAVRALDVVGHSYVTGGGTTGEANGYIDRLAAMLRATRVRNFGSFGAVAAWNAVNGNGDGGWAWVLENVIAPSGLTQAAYMPMTQVAVAHLGLNDLAELGSGNPRPYQEAMRAILARLCAAATSEETHADWTFTGTWTGGGANGQGSGPSGGGWKFSNTVGDKATLAIPSGYPGGLVVDVGLVTAQSTYDYTITVKVDGSAVATGLRVQGSVVMAGAKESSVTLRLRPTGGGNSPFDIAAPALATAGAHTIEVSIASVASGFVIVDYGQVEADPLDGPLLVVPNLNRPYVYTPWSGSTNGATMSDAGVALFNTALASTLTEFPDRSLLVDIDAALGKAVGLFSVALDGGGHPNSAGHAVIAQTIFDALQSNADTLLTHRRLTRPHLPTAPAWLPVGPLFGTKLGQTPAFTNSWTHFGDPYHPLSYYRDVQGRVHLRGAIKSGTSATANIATMPADLRPAKTLTFVGLSSTGAIQRWTMTNAGVIAISNGGDTTRSEVSGELIYSPDA